MEARVNECTFRLKVPPLTALFDGLITPIGTVPGLVAHLAHLNTLSAPALELVRAIALRHWVEEKESNSSITNW